MKNLIRISDYTKEDIFEIFNIADNIKIGKYKDFLKGKTVVMFFSNSSIRTRITFEKGIHLLGGQSILFPCETLDKKESIKDVIGYINNWVDIAIVRHKKIDLIDDMAKYARFPIINAMTDINHPCEIINDLYSLSKIREEFMKDKYLFVGKMGNIGLTWKEASDLIGFELLHCCPEGYEIEGFCVSHNIRNAIKGVDIVCTDSLPADAIEDFKEYQVTKEIMDMADQGAVLNPCPPFYPGEEVSGDVIDSEYFVGYKFKSSLMEVQQAIIIFNLIR